MASDRSPTSRSLSVSFWWRRMPQRTPTAQHCRPRRHLPWRPVHSGPHPPNEATAMLLCSVRARHDALGSVAEGSAVMQWLSGESCWSSLSHTLQFAGPRWPVRKMFPPGRGLASSIARATETNVDSLRDLVSNLKAQSNWPCNSSLGGALDDEPPHQWPGPRPRCSG